MVALGEKGKRHGSETRSSCSSVAIRDGRLDARQGPAAHPDLVADIDLDASIDLMLRRKTPRQALADGTAAISVGEKAAFARLIDVIAWVPAA
jgi:hypothetical protein